MWGKLGGSVSTERNAIDYFEVTASNIRKPSNISQSCIWQLTQYRTDVNIHLTSNRRAYAKLTLAKKGTTASLAGNRRPYW